MAAPIPRIEALSTKNFSVAYSAEPSAVALFVYAGSGSTVLVGTPTVVTSDTRHFNAFFTAPNSPGSVLAYTWAGSFTAGMTFHRGYVHIIKTEG